MGSDHDVVQSILLFGLSAKLWFTLHHQREEAQSKLRGSGTRRRRSNSGDKSSGSGASTDDGPSSPSGSGSGSRRSSGKKHQGSAEAWRRRRHRRRRDATAVDATGGGEATSPKEADSTKASVPVKGITSHRLGSNSDLEAVREEGEDEEEESDSDVFEDEDEYEDEDDDADDEFTELEKKGSHAEEELKVAIKTLEDRRRILMDRISLSDSILSRTSDLDFHPKNSNWCHFENYTPSFNHTSPKKSPVACKGDPKTPPPMTLTPSSDTDSSVQSQHATFTKVTGVQKVGTNAANKFSMIGDDLQKVCQDAESEGEAFLWTEPLAIPEGTEAVAEPVNSHDSEENEKPETPKLTRRYSTDDAMADRALFNAEIMPRTLICIRHGQSEGNINEKLYATKPDNAMRLTELGWEMARMAGQALRKQYAPGESVHFVVSPYARTVETFHGLVSAWCDPKEFSHIKDRNKRMTAWYSKLMRMGLTWHEDPRIREQDFGNYQDPEAIQLAKKQKNQFGPFYYRFPNGESASDVFDRVSTFLDSLWRSFEVRKAENYVLVTHGISVRVFLARYFRYTIDQFNMLANPQNCEMITLAHDGRGRLQLDGRCELNLEMIPNEKGDSEKEDMKHKVVGYSKHRRLRTLPPEYVQARTIRMSFDDDV